MVATARDHTEFLAWLDKVLPTVLPTDPRSLAAWSGLRTLVEQTDTGRFLPVLLPLYASMGRPAHDPGAMMRTLLVMEFMEEKSLDTFAKRLLREPPLATLCGFPPGKTPGASTCRDFYRRLYRRVIRSFRIAPSSRRLRLKLKPGEKMPPRHKGIIGRVARAAMGAMKSGKTDSSTDSHHDLLLAAAVATSAEKGLLGDPEAIRAGGDGSPLRTGANSYGTKICSCTGRCTCPRSFSDPDARAGWDSREHHYFFGHTIYALVAAGTSHNLPLTLGLYPGNRHDATIFPREVVKFHRLSHDLRLSHGILDAAHDQIPLYTFMGDLGITPVVDPVNPEGLRKPGPLTTPHGITWNRRGLPVCRESHTLVRRGRAGKGRPRFACPLQNATSDGLCERPCPFRDRLFVVNDRHNPRLSGDAPYGSTAWEKIYPDRTVNERVYAAIKDHIGLKRSSHRRRYIWLGRLTIAAILLHVKAWLKHPPDTTAASAT